MTRGLFRVAAPDGGFRLAVGTPEGGPDSLLSSNVTVSSLLSGDGHGLRDALAGTSGAPLPSGSRVVAPLDLQEVWASGVTYRRSRDARKDESVVADVYDMVYVAERPELFFKAPGWRVVGPGEPVGIRRDSTWDVPEPELALVIAADGTIVGQTIGNDMSSRSIEGENPLYLPQAKVFERSCALGPCIIAYDPAQTARAIRMVIRRGASAVVEVATSTSEITRSFESLAEHLYRALDLPHGAVLLTGTGIVPSAKFTLRAEDVVEIEIEGMGRLANSVISVGRSAPDRPETGQ